MKIQYKLYDQDRLKDALGLPEEYDEEIVDRISEEFEYIQNWDDLLEFVYSKWGTDDQALMKYDEDSMMFMKMVVVVSSKIEPEDATLDRAYRWVIYELNELGAELS